MFFFQFQRSYLQPPTTEIVGSCYRTSNGAFWKKWSSEFISSLQPRKKWQDAQPNLKEDDIVLIKEEGPPGTWPMARVLQVHPGNDGLVRVATVKTQDSVFKRPVHKLHKLPIYPN
ncbi:integrase catalytic domain-containing protein [Trichonephila clavipes]|nr:integrase catalytic domain-containing protein [Trichonephila clavipes]